MSKKTSTPPPRPPAPKIGGGGISFSFKALEEEDEDELSVVTGKFDKQVFEEKERHALALERERSLSKSPETRPSIDVNIQRSPSIKSQNSFEKLKDIKEKLHSEFQKKKEELFTDSNITQVQQERAPEKEVETIVKEKHIPLKSEKASAEEDANSLQDSSEFKSATDLEVDDHLAYFDVKTDDKEDIDASADADPDDMLEINEEYFNPNGEDFSNLPGVVPMLRQRKRFQKIRKIKPIVPVAPVSMSRLSQKNPEPETVSEKSEVSSQQSENKNDAKSTNEIEAMLHIRGVNIPLKKFAIGVIIFFLYIIIPLPSYLSGMVIGVILSSAGWMMYLWVNEPAKPREPIPDDIPLDKLPPLPVPEIKEPKGEDCAYKGWMNELVDYNPDTYSINQTHSIYVHLEGTTLRLRRPKINVPKRAMWDEPNPNPQFIHQRHFDIEGSKVLLLPNGLVKKRLWSKKYPICIALAKDGKKQSMKQETSGRPNGSGNQSAGRMSSSSSTDSVPGFEVVTEHKCESSILYIFARTCREKEQWYRRFLAATNGAPLKNHIREIKRVIDSSSSSYKRSSSTDSFKNKRQNSSDSISSVSTSVSNVEDTGDIDLRSYVMYMSRLIPRDKDSNPSSPIHSTTGKEKESKLGDAKSSIIGSTGSKGIVCEPALLPLNALLGRCFWDFLGDQYWADKVKDKLQKKLSKIHIPYFIEELQITEISLGSEVPVIRRANRPYLDENGFWIDLDVTYSGKFKMTIETKVNLLKLKSTSVLKPNSEKTEHKRSAVTDSDEEDSAESSTDEEEEATNVGDDGSAQSGGAGKKIMKYINKIAASKYFQSAAENKYIKKAMTEVSNTPLILTVEVQKLSGTLAINIPPLPSDRLWYGFRGNPQLWLVAKPKVGEREVTMSHITDWIEKKLALEFQHVLVMPNMDDLVIPILMPGAEVDAATGDLQDEPSSTA